MSSSSDQQLVDGAAAQLQTSVTDGLGAYSTNNFQATRTPTKDQLDVLERLEARQARKCRRPFSKIVLRGWS